MDSNNVNINNIEITNSEQKKVFLLMEAFVFHYHDLDKFEINLLNETAKNLNAESELDWAIEFINKDRITSFERTRNYLIGNIEIVPESARLSYILKIWNATNAKGYITEMEALALIRIAKDWRVEGELMKQIRKN